MNQVSFENPLNNADYVVQDTCCKKKKCCKKYERKGKFCGKCPKR